MRIDHHPDDSTILAYAAGTVNEGFSLVLAAHLECCPCCRDRLADAEALGGVLLTDLPHMEVPAGGLDDVWERIEISPESEPHIQPAPPVEGGLPGVLSAYLDSGLDSIPWRSLVPGIHHYVFDKVDCGRGTVRLLSIAPGITIPQHTHEGGELTLVLKGSYQDEIGRFQSGDLADLDPSMQHQPVADKDEPCICLIATEAPLHFSGLLNRMLQPLIGI